jgi:hypothetical protein
MIGSSASSARSLGSSGRWTGQAYASAKGGADSRCRYGIAGMRAVVGSLARWVSRGEHGSLISEACLSQHRDQLARRVACDDRCRRDDIGVAATRPAHFRINHSCAYRTLRRRPGGAYVSAQAAVIMIPHSTALNAAP